MRLKISEWNSPWNLEHGQEPGKIYLLKSGNHHCELQVRLKSKVGRLPKQVTEETKMEGFNQLPFGVKSIFHWKLMSSLVVSNSYFMTNGWCEHSPRGRES